MVPNDAITINPVRLAKMWRGDAGGKEDYSRPAPRSRRAGCDLKAGRARKETHAPGAAEDALERRPTALLAPVASSTPPGNSFARIVFAESLSRGSETRCARTGVVSIKGAMRCRENRFANSTVGCTSIAGPGTRNEALDARCYAYAGLQSLIAGRFRLNKQADQIEAMLPKAVDEAEVADVGDQFVPPPAEQIDRRDWFTR